MKNGLGLNGNSIRSAAPEPLLQPTPGFHLTTLCTTFGRFILALTVAPAAFAAPTDGTIISGNATITQPSADHTVIHQTTDKAIINWRDFNIGATEHTQFIQPGTNSITLNRVTGNNPSEILGRLTANGNVMLINPNGILFGANSRVDVGGLIASTADLTNDDFNNGNYRFTTLGNPNAHIENYGEIIARTGGSIALVAPFVSNHGTIRAHLGKVQLAAGNTWALDMGGLVKLAVNNSTASALIQAGLIEADGGHITLTTNAANDLLGNTINITGTTRARTVGLNQQGNIVITGNTVKVAQSAKLDANATQQGNGGTITILSDKSTQFLGHASARGGELGGNGGFIEVSSTGALDFQGNADTFAPHGHNGTLLLDPTDLTISNSSGSGIINITTLQNMLTANNVMLQTTTGSGNGDITLLDALTWNGDNTLSLQAHRDINISGNIKNNGNGSLILNATSTTGSTIRINNTIDIGGDLTLRTRALDITQGVSGRGILNLLPNSVSTSIGLGSSIGTFNLNSNEIRNILPGWAEVRIGQTNSTALTTLNTSQWQNNTVFNTKAELSGNISNQNYNFTFNKDVTLGNDTALEVGSGALTFGSTVNSGTTPSSLTITGTQGSKAIFNSSIGTTRALNDLTITTDELALAGYLNGTGTLTLQPAADSTTAGIGDNASGTFHLSTTELGNISSAFSNVIIGRSTSTANLDLQTSTWKNPVTFRGSITASGNITTQNQALTLQGNSTVNAGNAATFNTGTATFTNSGTFNSFGDLTIIADDVNLTGNLHGTGTLTLQPFTINRGLTLGDFAANTLQLTNDNLNRILSNWQNILLYAKTINVLSATAFGNNNFTLQADNLNLQATLSGTGNLTLKPLSTGASIGLGNNATGTLKLDDFALGRLTPGWANIFIGDTTGGTIDLRSSTWASPVTFNRHVTLFADTTLNAGSITFAETLDGNHHNLAISAVNGTITFAKAVSNLGSGTGAALNIINAGFTQALNTFSALGSLNVNSNSLWQNDITATDSSTFNGNTTFAELNYKGQGPLNFNGDVTLTNGPTSIVNEGDITFSGSINGPYNLSVDTHNSNLTFNKPVNIANLNTSRVNKLSAATIHADNARLTANHITADVDVNTLTINGQSATLTGRVGYTKSQQAMANNVTKAVTPGPNSAYTLNGFEIGGYNPAEEADTSKVFQYAHPFDASKLPTLPAFDELALLITPAAGSDTTSPTTFTKTKTGIKIITGK